MPCRRALDEWLVVRQAHHERLSEQCLGVFFQGIRRITDSLKSMHILFHLSLTCRKHGVSASEALTLLFQGKLPAFVWEGAE